MKNGPLWVQVRKGLVQVKGVLVRVRRVLVQVACTPTHALLCMQTPPSLRAGRGL
jgi:hypothetical protein